MAWHGVIPPFPFAESGYGGNPFLASVISVSRTCVFSGIDVWLREGDVNRNSACWLAGTYAVQVIYNEYFINHLCWSSSSGAKTKRNCVNIAPLGNSTPLSLSAHARSERHQEAIHLMQFRQNHGLLAIPMFGFGFGMLLCGAVRCGCGLELLCFGLSSHQQPATLEFSM